VDLRLGYPDDRVCHDFADVLEARGESNASAVLRAIVHEHIQPKRKQLIADARERAADARDRELRQEEAARQREYRAARRISLADAIELFLAELDERYTGKEPARVDRDGSALVKLGKRLANHVVAVTLAKERHDPQHAKVYSHKFADGFVRVLGFALAQPYPRERTSVPSRDASLGTRRFD
jgi:hypothetical protein